MEGAIVLVVFVGCFTLWLARRAGRRVRASMPPPMMERRPGYCPVHGKPMFCTACQKEHDSLPPSMIGPN